MSLFLTLRLACSRQDTSLIQKYVLDRNFWHPTPTCRTSFERVDYGALPFPPLPTDTGTCPLHTIEKIYGILQQSGPGFLDVHLQSPLV